jgi:hypothetical protein
MAVQTVEPIKQAAGVPLVTGMDALSYARVSWVRTCSIAESETEEDSLYS